MTKFMKMNCISDNLLRFRCILVITPVKVMCMGNSGDGYEYALNYQCNNLLLITNVVEYSDITF